MPPALYPYFSAALARLPEALCASTTPVSAIADLPVAFKDEVCARMHASMRMGT